MELLVAGNKVIDISVIFSADVLEQIVFRSIKIGGHAPWFGKKDRIVIRDRVSNRVRPRKFEDLRKVQLIAVLDAGSIEPGSVVHADGIDN